MSAKKPEDAVKLPGPQEVPEPVKKMLESKFKLNPLQIRNMRAVILPGQDGMTDIRIFEEDRAQVKKLKIENYHTFDSMPELIAFEGKFNKHDKKSVDIAEKAGIKALPDTKIYTLEEMVAQIEGMKVPGNTVFFYLAGSSAAGGPLGRGAAVVELNPNYPGEKQKKYVVYVQDIDGMELVNEKQKMFDSDKAKQIAQWIKERHYKPTY